MAAPGKRITVVIEEPQMKGEARFGDFAIAIENVQFSPVGVNATFHIR